MSTFKFEGNPTSGGLPRKSNLRVESLPQRFLVFEGKVSEAVYLDLDPGKYVYSVVRKSSPPRIDDAIYQGEFLHELTEEVWKTLQRFEPKEFKVMHTSEGARWRCKRPLCESEYSTAISALIHEMEHGGMTREAFLADPLGTAARAAVARAAVIADQVHVQLKAQGKIPTSGIPA
jgi:hypothetical protein